VNCELKKRGVLMKKKRKIISKLIAGMFIVSSAVVSLPQKAIASELRLGGADRYETSTAVSKEGWTSSDYVVLANGQSYADALCAAPIAKKYGAPILLTSKDKLSDSVKSEIERLNASNVIEMGGTGVISTAIENELKTDMSLNVTRIGGKDRYETSVLAAKELGSFNDIVLASGEGYADALSIAPIAASQGYPILLTSKNSIPESVKDYISSNKSLIKNSYVIGGDGVISDSSVSGLPSPIRLMGNDRYATNVSVINHFKSSMKFDKLYVVRGNGPKGNEFADALSVSSLAAKTSSPVILTYNTLSETTENFIKSNIEKDTDIIAVGGTASVPDSLISTIKSIVEEAADTSTTQPSAGGGGGGSSSSSSSDVSKLKSISTKLKSIDTSKLDTNQKAIISSSITAIDNYTSDTSYDYSEDVSSIKSKYESLSDDEQDTLQTAIVDSGIGISDLLTLKNQFGL
jgi:N-acetylmuramoyl-L-alanine amidase